VKTDLGRKKSCFKGKTRNFPSTRVAVELTLHAILLSKICRFRKTSERGEGEGHDLEQKKNKNLMG